MVFGRTEQILHVSGILLLHFICAGSLCKHFEIFVLSCIVPLFRFDNQGKWHGKAMYDITNAHKILVRIPETDLSDHVKITGNYKVGECGLDTSGWGYRPVVGSCEQGN